MFRLEISTDNNAFVEGAHDEIARILENAAASLRAGSSVSTGNLIDVNGNSVGQWQYTPED